MTNLTASWLNSLPELDRQQFLTSLTPPEREALLFRWAFWARPNQFSPPGAWRVWLLLAGRGFGKTRTGAEWVRHRIETGKSRRMALVAATAADARDVMVEGESGILAISPPSFRPLYEPSKRRLTWPNGAIATLYSAEEAQRLRGPQHDDAWCDEVAAWADPETWDMLMFGLRLGDDPRCCVTTTPKPVPLVLDLIKSKTTALTKGSTYDNRANLAPGFFADIITKYEGTRLGRQELLAEMLDIGGLFFDIWNEKVHVVPTRPVPQHYTFFGGLDWGKAAPFCFELACCDERGKVSLIAEVYEAGLTNWEQAQAICRTLEERGVGKHSCLIYADPSMFPPSDPAKRIGAYNIEDFQKAGLICIPAVNDRISGWSRVKEFLQTEGAFEVFAGCCPNFVRTVALMVEDDRNKEDLRKEPKQEDHAVDPVRYLLMSRPRPATPLPPQAPAQWGIVDGEVVEWEPARTLPRELQDTRTKERLL
jgi:hypothetical protein